MRIMITILIVLYASSAYSFGKVNQAYVVNVRVDRNGWGIVTFDSPIVGDYAPKRNANYVNHFSFDTNTEGGKALYTMALTAVASGKRITAYGTGACSEYTDTVESWSYGHLYKD